MQSFHRSQVTTLRHRLAEEPHRLIAVFGPRQAGKTTIVRQVLGQIDLGSQYRDVDAPDSPAASGPSGPSHLTFPISHVRDVDWLVRNWEEARRMAARPVRGFVLVFDEIQKIPRWSEAVKGLWDADRAEGCPLHVVILGSAPLLIQSGLHESLAGRFESIRVTHWSFKEMSEAFGFDLPQYLYFGGYPGAARFVADLDRWRDYILGGLVEPNIERDILSMTRVDKPALLRQLFELGCRLFGADPVLQQDARPTPGCRQYDDSSTLPPPALECWPAHRVAEVLQQTATRQKLQPQAQRAQHRPDDGQRRVFLRSGPGRPHILGAPRRERGRCTPVQFRGNRRSAPLLAIRGTRGGLRPSTWSARHPDRGNDEPEEAVLIRDGGFQAGIQALPFTPCRGRRDTAE